MQCATLACLLACQHTEQAAVPPQLLAPLTQAGPKASHAYSTTGRSSITGMQRAADLHASRWDSGRHQPELACSSEVVGPTRPLHTRVASGGCAQRDLMHQHWLTRHPRQPVVTESTSTTAVVLAPEDKTATHAAHAITSIPAVRQGLAGVRCAPAFLQATKQQQPAKAPKQGDGF